MTGPQQGNSFGALTMKSAQLAVKFALNMVLSNRQLMEYIASQAYTDETGGKWDKLPIAEKALWSNRVQSTIRAISGTVGL